MAELFAMPKLGLNMTQGTIVTWLVNEGDPVEAGQPVLEVETDKATQEVEAPASGILARIVRQEGDEVPCNQVIAVITDPGEAVPDDIPLEIAEGVAPKSALERTGQTASSLQAADEPNTQPEKRISISPSARKLAEELGVDIAEIKSTGNRIKRSDVEAAYEAQQQSQAGDSSSAIRVKPMSTMRRRTAEHMNHSARNAARVGLTVEVDASGLTNRRELTLVDGKKASLNVLLAEQVARALKAYPYMNAQMKEDEIWEFEDVNLGFAADTERGLLVPLVRAVGDKSLEELQRNFTALVERALNGKSTIEDLEGGTFTITNLGGLGIESFLPVINLPECAILGVGALIEKPVAVGGKVEIRPMMKLTLAFDHRLVDGAPAARFLAHLKTLIEEL